MQLPSLLTADQLTTSKAQLQIALEEIEATLGVMSAEQIEEMYVFHVPSLLSRDGALRKLAAFVQGLSDARRRLSAGIPITAKETKADSRQKIVQPVPAAKKPEPASTKVTEDESTYEALQQIIQAMNPEVRRRVAETLANASKENPVKKSKSVR